MTKTIFELKPTYGCNQKCDFCCFSSIKNRQMTKKEVFSNLDFIFNKRQINTFILSGGEPTIYCYFWEILDYLKRKKVKNIIIHTNAIKLSSEAFVKKLKKYHPKLMISLHTLNNK